MGSNRVATSRPNKFHRNKADEKRACYAAKRPSERQSQERSTSSSASNIKRRKTSSKGLTYIMNIQKWLTSLEVILAGSWVRGDSSTWILFLFRWKISVQLPQQPIEFRFVSIYNSLLYALVMCCCVVTQTCLFLDCWLNFDEANLVCSGCFTVKSKWIVSRDDFLKEATVQAKF